MTLNTVAIYALCDPDTGEVRYVGKTTDPKRRMGQHRRRAKLKQTHCASWIAALMERERLPVFVILEEIHGGNWINAERRWVTEYRERGARLTNLTSGGEGRANRPDSIKRGPLSPEHRAKLSEAAKGRRLSPEHKAILLALHKGHPRSEETKARIAAGNKGRRRSEETKARMSIAQTERQRLAREQK